MGPIAKKGGGYGVGSAPAESGDVREFPNVLSGVTYKLLLTSIGKSVQWEPSQAIPHATYFGETKMSESILSTASSRALSQWSGKKVAATKGLSAVADALKADGIVSDDLVAVKGAKEPSPIITAVKVAIVAGFTVAVQELLKKETKSLTESKKIEKRYWQQQIGSCLKDVRNALKTREGSGAGGQRSLKELIHAEVSKRMEQVQKDEQPNYDAVELLKVMALVVKLTKN